MNVVVYIPMLLCEIVVSDLY